MGSLARTAQLSRSAGRRSFLEARRGALSRTLPPLVIEGQRIPRVPVDTPLGAALGISGAILSAEALVSLFSSPEQGTWPTVFRLFRLSVGGGLMVWTLASTR
jgi:hypothetical protein